jgi:hypothetical protein
MLKLIKEAFHKKMFIWLFSLFFHKISRYKGSPRCFLSEVDPFDDFSKYDARRPEKNSYLSKAYCQCFKLFVGINSLNLTSLTG